MYRYSGRYNDVGYYNQAPKKLNYKTPAQIYFNYGSARDVIGSRTIC